MSEHKPEPMAPENEQPYEAPAIAWEDELPQGAGLFAACGKITGQGSQCNSYPAS